MQYEAFGRIGWAIDLFVYFGIAFLLFGFVTSTRSKIEIAFRTQTRCLGLLGSRG